MLLYFGLNKCRLGGTSLKTLHYYLDWCCRVSAHLILL